MIDRFMKLFDGLDRAYGEYRLDKKAIPGKKNKGKAATKKDHLTPEVWSKHLLGEVGLGIVPIRDDNSCMFGAIDIDSYDNFDIIELVATIENNSWPLVVTKSKSGGAHIWMFMAVPVPASIVRSKLKEIAIALKQAGAEIFPKQDKMMSKDDIGNWINMPYFGGLTTERYCVRGKLHLDANQFLDYAESLLLTENDVLDISVGGGEFNDAPPCLEVLTIQGFPGGSMNNALFNLGVYSKLKFEHGWADKLSEYNQRFLGPGSYAEVQQVIKSLEKKKYIYRCQEAPICGLCNKNVCNNREFGIQSERNPYKTPAHQKVSRPCILEDVETPVICYEPPEYSGDEPYWVFRIHGQSMDVTVDMVSSQLKFIRGYLKKFKRVLLPVDENRWAKMINGLLEAADLQEMAGDAGPEGQLWVHLENFCTGRVQARTKEELILGKPWNDNGRVYFRSTEFIRYLDTNRFKEFKEREIYAIFNRNGAQHHKFVIKGKMVSCWSVEEFKPQTEEFTKAEPLPETF